MITLSEDDFNWETDPRNTSGLSEERAIEILKDPEKVQEENIERVRVRFQQPTGAVATMLEKSFPDTHAL